MSAPIAFLVAGITVIGAALVVTIAGQVSPLLKTQVPPYTHPSPSPSPSPFQCVPMGTGPCATTNDCCGSPTYTCQSGVCRPSANPSPSSSLSPSPSASPLEDLTLLVNPMTTTALPGELVTITATTNRPADIALEIVP